MRAPTTPTLTRALAHNMTGIKAFTMILSKNLSLALSIALTKAHTVTYTIIHSMSPIWCRTLAAVLLGTAAVGAQAQPAVSELDDSLAVTLDAVTVTQRSQGLVGSVATDTRLITARELTRAACCNLGESFTTNPSVDVNYSDAATGARQIKLLGLGGAYVQMLVENIPAMRGGAMPFGLGYIAGPWMQSMQVSKGTASVKHGYESLTGQINIELRKPQLDPSLTANAYIDQLGKDELNLTANTHPGNRWSTGLLAHGEQSTASHDRGGDSFADMPRQRQLTIMSRWARLGSSHAFQGAVTGLVENRRSGQITHHHVPNPYIIDITTRRVEAWAKNAFILDRDRDANIALILSGNHHSLDSRYGNRFYDLRQWEGYASLMYECKLHDRHGISTGLSLNHDCYSSRQLLQLAGDDVTRSLSRQTVAGSYFQYTLDLDGRLLAMGGLRYDYNSAYGSLVTPRAHVRYNPGGGVSLSASGGIGRRAPHPLEQFHYLLASSRSFTLEGPVKMETSRNWGVTASWDSSLADHHFTLSADYYNTHFTSWTDADLSSSPHAVIISSSNRYCRSQVWQLEATADIMADMQFTAAYRRTDSRADYGQGTMRRPLTSLYKALFSLGWQPMMGLWQLDITTCLNGPGRFPTPYTTADGSLSWPASYRSFWSLNAQLTRNWRHIAVYIGGENLTGYTQRDPVIGAHDPWGPSFDATMVYAPLHGALVYVGFRYNITKYL